MQRIEDALLPLALRDRIWALNATLRAALDE